MSHSVSASTPLLEAIASLRALSQVSVQTGWRYCDDDLPIAEAVQPQTWQDWAIADLNAREHIAWAKGKKVRWLGQTIVVPHTLQKYPLQGMSLRLALMWWAESAQVFVDGQLVQEGDLFDCSTRLLLSPAGVPGEERAIALRLISPGHDDAALVRSVCLYEEPSANRCPEPSFIADELAVLQRYLQTFAPEKVEILEQAVAELDWAALPDRAQFDRSLSALRQRLHPFSAILKQRQIQLLGHAHLDMAWLWDVEETWRAAERTFESVLNLQHDFPELTFCHSTPALYDWMEQHRSQVFDRIQQQVQSGRWEVVGGLWIEPELNLISGESLVRQVLYGQRYAQARFGAVNAIAWLPDSFGFCWQLPQILRQGGVEYFVTQKLRWNDTTQFPYDVFWWRSPDGSQILSLMSAPIGEGIDPVKMTAFACDWEMKTGISSALWLPGVGDHGGGPTRDMLEVARRWQRSPFFPQMEFTTAMQYLRQIQPATDGVTDEGSASVTNGSSATSAPKSAASLPVWNSDLYLEFHRGCYTTHADQKRLNRRSESLLYEAELWASLATITANATYPKAELEAAWKRVLFNQFHDILPGSAIPQVFVDANRAWEQVEQTGSEMLQQSLGAIARQIALPPPPHPGARAIVVFNSLNWQRSQIVQVPVEEIISSQTDSLGWEIRDLEGQRVTVQNYHLSAKSDVANALVFFLAEDIPAIGYRCFWLCPGEPTQPTQPSATEAFVLENEYLSVTIDATTGEIASLFDKLHQRQVLAGPGNQLQAFQDSGQYWDAWNIDPNYAQHPLPPAELVEICYRNGSATGVATVHKLGQSTFYQTYILQPGSPLLQIETHVDWQERHVLVKAAFPLNLEADSATYEIPCGAIERTTRPQNDREKAQWEVPALHWADLSDDAYGVSLLNDCKYGYDTQPHQLRLTLLRGAEWPDPDADRGWHHFTYALYPHTGNWKVAQTVRQGYEINVPLQVLACPVEESLSGKSLPPVGQCFDLGADNLVLMAFKQAEDSPNQWVIRCYECHGDNAMLTFRSNLGLQLNGAIDLLEQPVSDAANLGSGVPISPWKIASFKISTPALKD